MTEVRISMDEALLARLRTQRPFSCLSEAQLAYALESASLDNAPAGTALVRPDHAGNDCLVLFAGELEMRRPCLSGDGVEGVRTIRAGADAAPVDVAVLHAVPREADVRTLTPACVLRIDGERLDEILAWSQQAAELRRLSNARACGSLMRQVLPFRRLPLENVQRAFDAMRPLTVQAGETVVRQGDPGDRYYVIEQGRAEVWRVDPLTDETGFIRTLGPGDGFGEEALLLGGYRTATVTMLEDGCLLALDKNDFDALMKSEFVEEIDAARAQALTAAGAARWLDCRYDVEFDEAHIPGAVHLPLDNLRDGAAGLQKEAVYIIYCRSGRRSGCAAFLLYERGFRVYSLTGGIRDWPYAVESGG